MQVKVQFLWVPIHSGSAQSPLTNLTRGLAARLLFRVPPYQEGTIHLQTSMPSPSFEPRAYSTAIIVTNHYTGWVAISTFNMHNRSILLNLYQSYKKFDIVNFIKIQQIKWEGHIVRMDENRTTKKVFNAQPIGTQTKDKPILRRIDGLEKSPSFENSELDNPCKKKAGQEKAF
ncbi:uncharacterized protein TNCV_343331 [Trichonephila clavipes]|nr:uncharacterized protein TNCV_343331 [Trichonephila clavipes]